MNPKNENNPVDNSWLTASIRIKLYSLLNQNRFISPSEILQYLDTIIPGKLGLSSFFDNMIGTTYLTRFLQNSNTETNQKTMKIKQGQCWNVIMGILCIQSRKLNHQKFLHTLLFKYFGLSLRGIQIGSTMGVTISKSTFKRKRSIFLQEKSKQRECQEFEFEFKY